MRKNTLEERDFNLISRYNVDEIYLISYFNRKETATFLKENSTNNKLNFSKFYFFKKEDTSISDMILTDFLYELQSIMIDITNASTLHSAILSAMAQRYDMNVNYQTENESKIHPNSKPYYYDDITKSELLILNQMTSEFKNAEQIKTVNDKELDICRSNLYKLLDSMSARGIISKPSTIHSLSYKGRHLYEYYLTTEQQADLMISIKRKTERLEKIQQAKMSKRKNKLRK